MNKTTKNKIKKVIEDKETVDETLQLVEVLTDTVDAVKSGLEGQILGIKEKVDTIERIKALNGKDGKQGERGLKGDKGDKGDKGEKGEKGEAGRDGVDGKDGKKGEKGIDGRDGKDGKKGKDGKNGLNGKDGKTPVKGEDYFTEPEIKDIQEEVIKKVKKLRVYSDRPTVTVAQWGDIGGTDITKQKDLVDYIDTKIATNDTSDNINAIVYAIALG